MVKQSRSTRLLAGILAVAVIGVSSPVGPANANISDNPGFSSGDYSVCNYPNSGDSTTSYGPDRNPDSISWTNSNWKCTKDGAWVSGATEVAVNQPLLMEKLDLQTPRFGGGGYQRDLTSIVWDFDTNGTVDKTDNGPWNSWYLDRGHPYVRGTYFSAQHSWATPGDYTITVTANYDDATSDSVTGTVKVVADTVTAAIARTLTLGGANAGSSPVLEGASVFLSAAASSAIGGVVSKYEWDLNGDDIYEIDGGSASTYTTSFTQHGTKTVGVRVTSRGGLTATATTSIEVRKVPPVGEAGVSIKNGASYTNTKAVQLNLVWPEYATEVRVSNDGGFAASKTQTVSLAETVNWELDDSVAGIFTKVVYVRFSGSGVDTTKTYSDDIILDTTAPTIESSAATAEGSKLAVSLKATDDITGVDDVQIKSESTTVTKDYTTSLSVPVSELGLVVESSAVRKMAATKLQVRVSDKAGNWTEWRSLSVAGVKSGAATSSGASSGSGGVPAAKPLLAAGSNAKYSALAAAAKLVVAKGSRVSIRVPASSLKICRPAGGVLIGLKTGTCRVTVTVAPKAGRAKSKTLTLKL